MMYNKFITSWIIATAFLILVSATAVIKKYDYKGNIESITETELTVLFYDPPDADDYLLLVDNEQIGTFSVLSHIHVKKGKFSWRVIGNFSLIAPDHRHLLKAGAQVMIKTASAKDKLDYSNPYFIEQKKFKKSITSKIDNREMIIIPAGKFIMGSSSGDYDEKPEHAVFVPDFYMDVYEVSNSDYNRFVNSANAKPPKSWVNGIYPADEADLPVMATYYEAEKFANWCRKRIPSEQEWEKAAKGMQEKISDYDPPLKYPWGDKFDPENANSIEYWKVESSVSAEDKLLNKKKSKPVPLPVTSFQNIPSPFGIKNLSGNAREWTNSWYQPYPGNFKKNKNFGAQYKVIRGGGWYQERDFLRVSKRSYGGSPSLRSDNTAGFRCVKDPEPLERE